MRSNPGASEFPPSLPPVLPDCPGSSDPAAEPKSEPEQEEQTSLSDFVQLKPFSLLFKNIFFFKYIFAILYRHAPPRSGFWWHWSKTWGWLWSLGDRRPRSAHPDSECSATPLPDSAKLPSIPFKGAKKITCQAIQSHVYWVLVCVALKQHGSIHYKFTTKAVFLWLDGFKLTFTSNPLNNPIKGNTACCFAADPDLWPAPKQVSRVKKRGYASHFADLVLLVESPESVLLLRYHPVLQDPLCLSEALHEGVDKAVKLFRLRAEIYTGYLSHIHRLSIH